MLSNVTGTAHKENTHKLLIDGNETVINDSEFIMIRNKYEPTILMLIEQNPKIKTTALPSTRDQFTISHFYFVIRLILCVCCRF